MQFLNVKIEMSKSQFLPRMLLVVNLLRRGELFNFCCKTTVGDFLIPLKIKNSISLSLGVATQIRQR